MLLRRLVFLFTVALILASCMSRENSEKLPDLPTSEVPVTEVVVTSNGPNLPIGRLLFVKRGDIWMFEGSDIRRLTASGKTVHPRWSPDGQSIAYVQREESYADIYVKSIDREGRGVRLTRNEPPGIEARSLIHVQSVRWGFHPAWSPDGELLAYISQRYPPFCLGGNGCDILTEYPLSLYLFRLANLEDGVMASPEANLVLVKTDTDIQRPVWSPDGRYIAYTQASRYPPEGQSGVTIGFYDVEVGQPFMLTSIPDGAYDPAWSPDGKWLVFARRTEAGTDLWAIAAPSESGDGGKPFQLTHLGSARAPAWSPDGDYLAFLHLAEGSVDLKVAAVETGPDGRPVLAEPETLLDNDSLDADSGLSWAP